MNSETKEERRKILRRAGDRECLSEIQSAKQYLDLVKKDMEGLERIKPLVAVASSVVHDIRNSLGVISSTAQFVLSQLDPPERQKQAWELVLRNLESIQNILKSYLSLTRQAHREKGPSSLNDIAKRASKFLDLQMRKQNVKLEMDLDPAIPNLALDPSAIESAVLNIAINSLDAMKEGGTLKICTKMAGSNKVFLEIDDTGPGIPKEHVDKIFSPFFTTKKDGTGMGLYSAKANVEHHDGQILCESCPEKGTRMILCFPLDSLPPHPAN